MPVPCWSQETWREEIVDYIAAAESSGDLHGSVLVADRGGVIYEHAAGLASYEWNVPNTLETRFRIGSIAKQFTAVLIFQEVERGTIALDDTISEHLPYYRADTGGRVTVSHLLNHVSGVPDLVPDFSDHERSPYGRREFIERFCSGDLEFEPGARFGYSNAGYYILGAILEAATGESYGDLLRSRIFGPAGMDDAVYVEDLSIVERAANGYARNDGAPEHFTTATYIDPSVPFAMGGIQATVGDLYEWDRALYSEVLLSDESKAALYTPLEGGTYSNGWINYAVELPGRDQPMLVTMHQGSINGFSGVIFRDLERRNLVVVLNNVSGNGSEWRIGERLMAILASRQ